jgi:hypothetical protein
MRKFGGIFLAFTLCAPAFGQNLSFGLREARAEPDWVNKLTIYEIWLDAFSKEGTLRGAIPGLQRVSDLGASLVYLGPIAKRSGVPHASLITSRTITRSTPSTVQIRICATLLRRLISFI